MEGDLETLRKIKEKEAEEKQVVSDARSRMEEQYRKKLQEKDSALSTREEKLKQELENAILTQSEKLRQKGDAEIAEARKKALAMKLAMSDDDLKKMVTEELRNLARKG